MLKARQTLMNKKVDDIPFGVFPRPTLSQLEALLDDRQVKDRRKKKVAIHFEERRKRQRRVNVD